MPVIGGLTVDESAIISEMLASERSAFVTGAAAADVIAKVEEVSLTEAFQIIEKAQLQTQSNRYSFLVNTANKQIVASIAKKTK